MTAMLVTLAVLKLLTSRLVRALKPSNIDSIVVTLDVLKLLTSRLVKSLQLLNM